MMLTQLYKNRARDHASCHRDRCRFKACTCKKLSVEKLARSIAEAGVNDVRKRAPVIARGIRSENGVKCAVELIEEHLSNWRSGTIF
jgi:hypothetical protein